MSNMTPALVMIETFRIYCWLSRSYYKLFAALVYSTCHWDWIFFLNVLLLNFFQISYSNYSMKWKYWFWYHNGIGIKWRAKSNPIKWKGNLVSFEQIRFFCFLNWVSLYFSSTRFYKTNMWQILLFGNRYVISMSNGSSCLCCCHCS